MSILSDDQDSVESIEPIIFHVSSCEVSYVETDLDVKEFLAQSAFDVTQLPDYDETGQTYYINQCQHANVVPCSKYLRNIQTETLDLPHYGLNETGVKPLSESLIHNKTIKKINLADNWLCDSGVHAFITMVKVNEYITDLNLSSNRLTNESAPYLCEILANSIKLNRLDLSNNLYDDKSAIHFGELMILSLNLEYLNLSKNQFGRECLIPFGKAFLQTTSIKHLDLSFNHIGGLPKQVQRFCIGLTKNECFKILDLSSNCFCRNEDLFAFGKMLKTNVTLEELNLNNNHINTQAVVKLAKQLGQCKALRTLRIGHNPILSAGCYSIVKFFLSNATPPIKLLDFESVEVNDDFKTLAEALLNKVPDIVILCGVRMVKRIVPDIDPLKRIRIFCRLHEMSIVDHFSKYVTEPEDDFIELDKIPEIIDDFCKKNDFILYDIDRYRVYKAFPRNPERIVPLSILDPLFEI